MGHGDVERGNLAIGERGGRRELPGTGGVRKTLFPLPLRFAEIYYRRNDC